MPASYRDALAEIEALRQELAEANAALDRVRALCAPCEPDWGIRVRDILAAAEARPVDGAT